MVSKTAGAPAEPKVKLALDAPDVVFLIFQRRKLAVGSMKQLGCVPMRKLMVVEAKHFCTFNGTWRETKLGKKGAADTNANL